MNQDFVTIVLRVLHLIGPLSFSGSVQAGKRSYPQQKVCFLSCEIKLGYASSNATLFAFNTFFFESLMLLHRISCGAVSTWVANTSLAKWNLNTPQKSGNVLQSSLLFPELYNAPNTPLRELLVF